ncbi:MAG: PAS domain S-box protein [Ignavibacteria bacterium]|nr:PAS domain S-box protein [Ignavibacteria bacterium]
MLSRNTVYLLFVLGIIVLLSAGYVSYMNLRDSRESVDRVLLSFNRLNSVQNLEKILLHDHLHPDYESAKAGINALLDSLESSLDSATFVQLKPLAVERLNYLASVAQTGKNTPSRTQRLIEEKNKLNLSKLRSLISDIKKSETSKIESIKENSEKAGTFAKYTFIGGVMISIMIFVSVFLIQRNSQKWLLKEDDDQIPYEELEKIIKERTAEISAINIKLNKKIDEIRKIDEELKRSEHFYKTLFEQAHDAIMIISPETRKILEVNNRACEIYGFTKEEFSSISLDLISKNIPECKNKIKEIVTTGYAHNFECVHYTKDMREILIEINASLIEYNNSHAILSVNRDITDRVLKLITN